MQSQLLTINQAAEFLGLSERAVFRLKDAGDLGYVKLGRSLRFNVDELNRLIAANTKKASPRHMQQREG
jgi:excisionase family DNA binding protein